MLFYDSPHNCIGHIWRASLTCVLPCVSSKCPSRLLTNYNCCICETFSLTFVKYHSLVLILYVCVQITFPTCFKVTIFTCESQITFLNSFIELQAHISIIAFHVNTHNRMVFLDAFANYSDISQTKFIMADIDMK